MKSDSLSNSLPIQASRRSSPWFGKTWIRGGQISSWWSALSIALVLALLGATATAVPGAEFVTPAGLNVPAQEALLKERVIQMAEELVGDKLVDVSVSIGYIRTEEQAGGARNIKLPGFNHYIRPGKDKKANIISAHTRLRQVLVMVSDTLQSDPEALEQEIRLMGNLDASKGDLVKVIKVSPGGKSEYGSMGGQSNGKKKKFPRSRRKTEQDRLSREEENEKLGLMMAQGALIEAQSTTYLIKARAAFFKGDLDRALDQILQSISQNPNNPQAYAMLGSLYYAVDWKSMALKYWEKSLQLDPNNREIEELVIQVKQNPAQ